MTETSEITIILIFESKKQVDQSKLKKKQKMLCFDLKKHMSTFPLMFLFACYIIQNARRDTAEEKEFGIIIQMTLEDVLFHRFKKKMDEKTPKTKCYKCL